MQNSNVVKVILVIVRFSFDFDKDSFKDDFHLFAC